MSKAGTRSSGIATSPASVCASIARNARPIVVQTRGLAGLKRVTIGQHGEVTPEQARKDASEVIDRIKRGMDPMPEPPAPEVTIADLAERCVSAHGAVNCGPNTMKNYRNAIDAYIVPELGVLSLGAVDCAQVTALHYRLRDTPYQANKVVTVLSKMFSLADTSLCSVSET